MAQMSTAADDDLVAIPASDQTWLHMDRPNNLMYVRSILWFEEAPDLRDVHALLEDRLLGRHPVFRLSLIHISEPTRRS